MSLITNVKYDKALRMEQGLFIHNPKELLEQLKIMKDEEFKKYQEKNYETITSWLEENYKAKDLSLKIKKSKTKKEIIFHLENYVRIKESEQEIKKSISMDTKTTIQYALIVIILLFVGLQFSSYLKDQEESPTQTFIAIISGQAIEIQSLNEKNELLKIENEELKKTIEELRTYKSLIQEQEKNISPSDRIKIADLAINSTHLILKINNTLAAEFTNTGSMLPVLSSTATGIQIKPEKETDLKPGDIISYKYKNTIIVHRIVEVGYDETGWYAYAKGDNNLMQDKDKIRFDQIDRVLVAIIY